MLSVDRTCVGLTPSSFLQFPRCDDASVLQEPLVLCFLHCLPLHRALLHHEPGTDHVAKSPAAEQQPLVMLRHLSLCLVVDSKDAAVCFIKRLVSTVGIFWAYAIILICRITS